MKLTQQKFVVEVWKNPKFISKLHKEPNNIIEPYEQQ